MEEVILTERDLATIRAALLFWQEEMCPHGDEVVRPYFDSPEVEPLSAAEVEELRKQLAPDAVRYAAFDVANGCLRDTDLCADPDEAIRASEIGHVATVIIPLPPSA